MSDVLKFGLIGYGYWGPNLLRNFCQREDSTVSVCCDINPERWKQAAKLQPLIRFTTNVNELFDDPTLDGILIATPVKTHFELAQRALQSGKHVLVEKPLALRVEDAVKLHEMAARAGLILQVDHVFVYSPAVQKIKSIIEQGTLGKLFFIDSVRINLGLFQQDVNVLWDLAPHDLSIVDYLMKRLPRALVARGSSHTESGLEDIAYLNLDYGGSLIANIHVSWLSPVKIRSMMIGGANQSLIYNDLDSSERIKMFDRGINVNSQQRERMLISYRMGDMLSPYCGPEEPLALMAADFVHCIRTGSSPVADGESGVRITKILAAAEQSLREGGRQILF